MQVQALPWDVGQSEKRPNPRRLTFSKGQYLYILVGLVQMKTSVLGERRRVRLGVGVPLPKPGPRWPAMSCPPGPGRRL